MLSDMKSSAGELERRDSFNRTGRPVVIAAILLSASVGASFSGEYPVPTVAVQSASVDRPCTQLELSTDMTQAECGTLTLAEVVSRKYALETDDRDE